MVGLMVAEQRARSQTKSPILAEMNAFRLRKHDPLRGYGIYKRHALPKEGLQLTRAATRPEVNAIPSNRHATHCQRGSIQVETKFLQYSFGGLLPNTHANTQSEIHFEMSSFALPAGFQTLDGFVDNFAQSLIRLCFSSAVVECWNRQALPSRIDHIAKSFLLRSGDIEGQTPLAQYPGHSSSPDLNHRAMVDAAARAGAQSLC